MIAPAGAGEEQHGVGSLNVVTRRSDVLPAMRSNTVLGRCSAGIGGRSNPYTGDHVDGDAIGSELSRGGAGQRQQRAFRRRIVVMGHDGVLEKLVPIVTTRPKPAAAMAGRVAWMS